MKFEPEKYFSKDRLESFRRRSDSREVYPPDPERDYTLEQFMSEFETFYEEELDKDERREITLAGEVDAIRDHSNVTFIDLRDESVRKSEDCDRTQLIFTSDYLEDREKDQWIKDINTSDYLEVSGYADKSNREVKSLVATNYRVLADALIEPPASRATLDDNVQELSDKERVRNRVAAIQQDDELLNNLNTKSDITRMVRQYLWSQGFNEVETPVLREIYGGAEATPFETYTEALDENRYLRIALEIPQKKLMAGGMEKTFEVGKVFRNEDIDTTHNPEFTMLEVYEAFADREDMMEITEELVSGIAEEIHDDTEIPYDGEIIDFSRPWERMTVEDTINKYGDLDQKVENMTDDEIEQVAKDEGVEFHGGFNRGVGIMELYDEVAEDEIKDPTFVIDHPKEVSPLCKEHREKEGKAERFEVVVAGNELANSYTERNNPIKQGEHLAEQASRFEAGDEEAHRMDEDFVTALGRGMPPAGGLGIGIDRLTMLMTDSDSIKDVLHFPMVAREDSSEQK